jgi:hypothetical protein
VGCLQPARSRPGVATGRLSCSWSKPQPRAGVGCPATGIVGHTGAESELPSSARFSAWRAELWANGFDSPDDRRQLKAVTPLRRGHCWITPVGATTSSWLLSRERDRRPDDVCRVRPPHQCLCPRPADGKCSCRCFSSISTARPGSAGASGRMSPRMALSVRDAGAKALHDCVARGGPHRSLADRPSSAWKRSGGRPSD